MDTLLYVKKKHIPVNKYSRPGTVMFPVTGIVYHWVGKPMQPASEVNTYFASLAQGIMFNGEPICASAHYVIDEHGVIENIPPNERAYHAGIAQGKRFKPKAYKFGVYPPAHMVGIELCHLDWFGNFHPNTIGYAKKLGADLCREFSLNPTGDIVRHFDFTGKNCPRYFVEHEDEWWKFLDTIKEIIITDEKFEHERTHEVNPQENPGFGD